MERVIIHMDMDAFYAAVEQCDNKSLRGKPVIVGGSSNRGVVSTASYEARQYGVHSAMPIFQARQKCPHAVFLPVRMERYREISKTVMSILDDFSPIVEQVSIDEAYLDLTGFSRRFPTPAVAGNELKKRVFSSTSLTCSVGIAPNRFLAKIASDMEKPDGLTVIRSDEVDLIIRSMPIRKVPGIGRKTSEILKAMGVIFLGDIRGISPEVLNRRVGKFGKRLKMLADGEDEILIEPHHPVKSISSETTLPKDTSHKELLKEKLIIQAEIIGERIRKKDLKGYTIILKLRRSDYQRITRNVTLNTPTSSTKTIYEQGAQLLDKMWDHHKYRLIGLGISNFTKESTVQTQLNLFEPAQEEIKSPWEDAEKAIDRIRNRFGRNAIKRARFIEKKDP
jgi:DNA polymerase-4